MPAPHSTSDPGCTCVPGAAGIQQGEPACALETGSSIAPHSSMAMAQLHPPYLTAVLHYTPTQQLREEKHHFNTYAKCYSSLRYQDILLTLSTSGADFWIGVYRKHGKHAS